MHCITLATGIKSREATNSKRKRLTLGVMTYGEGGTGDMISVSNSAARYMRGCEMIEEKRQRQLKWRCELI